jgi:dihydropyrimidine dehydrogenase (NAD+) subunit PreT
MVVHGARCVGHGRCATECPVGAIALTLGDRSQRDDIPALTPQLEAIGAPGLFLAGEVTGFALVRNAVEQGRRVAEEVARRTHAVAHSSSQHELDLVVVGAGPAGLACSLEARRSGLRFLTLEQEKLGGTVAHYPRRKLVMTQPMDLPLGGRLERASYQKEDLIELWEGLRDKHDLPIEEGARFEKLVPAANGNGWQVHALGRVIHAKHVCLALGRRGTPRKLGAAGEDLHKVSYSLVDAQAYRGRKLLVVGGGDSAIEAAIGLAEQAGNEVTLSYRKEAFFRLKAKNELQILAAQREARVTVLFGTEVLAIEEAQVVLGRAGHRAETLAIPNDEVFVLAGGIPPFALLREAGVSFDPALQPEEVPLLERGTGLLPALRTACVLSAAALLAWWLYADYYAADPLIQAGHPSHDILRPARGYGLAAGIGAAGMMSINLAYLMRRSLRLPLNFGSLQAWMTVHVGSGLLALLLAFVHAGFQPGERAGGHALLGMFVLVLTGALGRYFYSFVPRAANGRELALEEAEERLRESARAWPEGHREFGNHARRELAALVDRARWQHGFFGAILGLATAQRALRKSQRMLRAEAESLGVDPGETEVALRILARAHRDAMAATHFEDVRGVLSIWRYLHRWVALLVVLLLVVHVVNALRYAPVGGLR